MNNRILKWYLQRSWFFIALTAVLAVVCFGWWQGSSADLALTGGQLVAVGRLFGLLSAVAILLEIVLMARIPYIEKFFDLHENLDLHRLNGYAVLLLTVAHVVAITVGYAAPRQINLITEYININTDMAYVLWASIGTGVFFGAVATSVAVVRRRLPHELWYAIHLTMYGAIGLTFLHQVNVGGDFVSQQWFEWLWYGLFGLVFTALAYWRVLRPIVKSWGHELHISQIVAEAEGVYSVYVSGHNVKAFQFEPGQYATWWVLSPGLWWQGHPFSFSGYPGQNRLRFTVKATGTYTEKLASAAIGSRIIVDGPRGAFTADRISTRDALLVGGGIGIAPLLVQARALLAEGRHVTILYATHDPEQVAFGQELAQLQSHGLRLEHFISTQGNRLTSAALKQFLTSSSTVYICGPDRLTRPVKRYLKGLGVPPLRIITEEFNY